MTIPIGISSAGTKTVPGAPTIVAVTDVGTGRAFNNGAVSVTFTAPTNDGRLPITSYTASGFCSVHNTTHTVTGASSPLIITGFGSSITSPITVVATNSVGSSAASAAVTSPTITSIPQVVTIGTATATGATTATVAFTPGSTGGKAVTYTATSSPGGITASGPSPITVSGLTASTTYTFTVVATNANGSTVASTASNSITTSSVGPEFVAPSFPTFVAPSFPTFVAPSFPTFVAPSFPTFVAPSFPTFVAPSFPTFVAPSFPTFTAPSCTAGYYNSGIKCSGYTGNCFQVWYRNADCSTSFAYCDGPGC